MFRSRLGTSLGALVIVAAASIAAKDHDRIALPVAAPIASPSRTPQIAAATATPAIPGSPRAAGARPILDTYVEAPSTFVPGAPAALRVVVGAAQSLTKVDPVANARIEASLEREGKVVAAILEARSDANGTVSKTVKFPDVAEGKYELVVRASTPIGTQATRSPVTVAKKARLLLLSDKPIYQPSQTIHLRALALHEFDRTPDAGAPVEIVVEDGKGNRIFKETRKTGEYGEISLDVRLADEVNEGDFHLRATLGGVETDKVVQVKKYVLPKFKVAVDAGKTWFAPGETVHGKIKADYFFGKPVAGGEVVVTASTFDVGFTQFARLTGRTDADGAFTFDLELPKAFAGQPLQNGDALFKLDAEVKDKAEHVERGTKSSPVSAQPFRVAIVPESGKLVPGVENRVWAIATRPDGEPLAGTKVAIVAGGRKASSVTDAAGIAALALTPSEADFTTAPRQWGVEPARTVHLEVSATAPQGDRFTLTEEVAAEHPGASLLLRADRAVYRAGDVARLDIALAKAGGSVYVDVVKQGQTVATRTVQARDGRAHDELALSPDLTGTLEVHAYVVPANGEIVRDTRILYVEPADDLSVHATPDRSVYRPGETAKIRLSVKDGAGRGVPAAIAAVIVDESVYALQEIQPGLEKVYFELERELAQPKYEIHGYSENISSMVRDPKGVDAKRQRAASILLAKAEDVYPTTVVSNPALQRAVFERQRLMQIGSSLAWLAQSQGAKVATHDEKAHAWKWAIDPVAKLRADQLITPEMAKDAWGRPLTVESLEAAGIPAAYDSIAANITAQRLQQSYSWLINYGSNHPTRVRSSTKDPWSAEARWKVPADTFRRMVRSQELTDAYTRDAWGSPLAIENVSTDLPARQGVWWTQLARVRVRSAGPDLEYGTDDDIVDPRLGQNAYWAELAKDEDLEVAGLGGIVDGAFGLGLRGHGMGGGGGDMRIALAQPAAVPAAALEKVANVKGAEMQFGSMGYKEEKRREASAPEAAISRVRQYFPETLLWEPSLITDAHGEATLEVPMADSITKWRMTCSANSKAGGLGSCGAELKVFQDFFVDLDLPVALTRGDEVAIPVAVYNYLAQPQQVRLVLETGDSFEKLSAPEQTLTIPAGEVDVRYFRIRARDAGLKDLQISAYGPKMSDAVKRQIEVVPDGTKVEVTKSDRIAGETTFSFDVPEGAVPNASRAYVKLYPGMFSQIVEGLDGILVMPGGCMEQTGSGFYPDVLVTNYLQHSKQMKPQIRMKAEEYVNLGYQRMLTFQTPSGGFALWGAQDTPKVFLTAWGLQILQDAAKVHTVDERVLARAKGWLAQQQQADGSFPVSVGVHTELWGKMKGEVGMTSYVVWSLAEGGDKSPMVTKAADYLKRNVSRIDDPYLLALAGAALASAAPGDAATRDVLGRLDAAKTADGKMVHWVSKTPTFVYATGKYADVETTALAAYALHKGGGSAETVNRALAYLVSAKDANGTWGSTQGTILSLKALLGASDPGATGDSADVTVAINGKVIETAKIRPENSDLVRLIDLRSGLKSGKNTITIASSGAANTMYQAVGRWYEPWSSGEKKVPAPEPLSLSVAYDRTHLAAEDLVTATVTAKMNDPQTALNVMLDLGIPPGFEPDLTAFDALKEKRLIGKYSVTGRQITVYLDELAPGKPLQFSYALKAKFPVKAKTPLSSAWEYYTPDKRGVAEPVEMVVVPKG